MISAEVKAAVKARDGHRCRRCGSGERLTVDHRVPRALGGGDGQENLQTLCEPCNQAKGAGQFVRLPAPADPVLRRALFDNA